MNLKERGITVGDLLIILIIIISSTILIKSFSKDKKTTLNFSNLEQVSFKKNYYQKFIWIAYLSYFKNSWLIQLNIKYLLCKSQELIIIKQWVYVF